MTRFKKNLLIVICISSALFIGLLLFQALRIRDYLKQPYPKMTSFEQYNPNSKLRILFVGDSTAVGTGANSNTESVAGWFAKDFPKAHIENNSKNGRKAIDLLNEFHPSTTKTYNLVIIQIGGNDILQLTAVKSLESQITRIIDRVKPISKNIAILHSGNVGVAPIFIWPVSSLYTLRSRVVRSMYIKKAKEMGVIYVDLFRERADDPFLKYKDEYYAKDYLHPSGQGYRWWYDRIRESLSQAGILNTN